jgi:hypothetical protein
LWFQTGGRIRFETLTTIAAEAHPGRIIKTAARAESGHLYHPNWQQSNIDFHYNEEIRIFGPHLANLPELRGGFSYRIFIYSSANLLTRSGNPGIIQPALSQPFAGARFVPISPTSPPGSMVQP